MTDYYLYSPEEDAFYPYSMKISYEDAGSWPGNGTDVDFSTFIEFTQNTPAGKKRGSDDNGYPVWVDIPPLTQQQLIADAELLKKSLTTEANQKTQLWQTQLMLGIITGEDKASLTEWMLYVQKVQTVDTSTAPDIIWPEKPE